jgi:hypothetical protein
MVLIAKKQIEQGRFLLKIYLFKFSFKAVLLNDVENVSILGLDQGWILLFSAISSSLTRVKILVSSIVFIFVDIILEFEYTTNDYWWCSIK